MNKVLRGLSLLGLSALTLVALSGCETGEDRDLASAQSCLDSAHTEADANRCIAMVEGLTTPEAYLVRCSANFIAQGFNGDKIADAFESIDDDSNTADPMVKMMAFLNFKDMAGVQNDVANIVTNCQHSGLQSMHRLATAANLATTLASLASVVPAGGITSAAEMEAVVADVKAQVAAAAAQMPPDPQLAITIGGAATTVHSAFCNAGSSYADEDICVDLAATIATGNTESIGQEILDLLLNLP